MKYFMRVFVLMLFINIANGDNVNAKDMNLKNFTIYDIKNLKQPPGLEIKISPERDVDIQAVLVNVQITNQYKESIVIDKKLLILSIWLQKDGKFRPAWSLPTPEFSRTTLKTGEKFSFSVKIVLDPFNECQFFVSIFPFLYNRIGIEIRKNK